MPIQFYGQQHIVLDRKAMCIAISGAIQAQAAARVKLLRDQLAELRNSELTIIQRTLKTMAPDLELAEMWRDIVDTLVYHFSEYSEKHKYDPIANQWYEYLTETIDKMQSDERLRWGGDYWRCWESLMAWRSLICGLTEDPTWRTS